MICTDPGCGLHSRDPCLPPRAICSGFNRHCEASPRDDEVGNMIRHRFARATAVKTTAGVCAWHSCAIDWLARFVVLRLSGIVALRVCHTCTL